MQSLHEKIAKLHKEHMRQAVGRNPKVITNEFLYRAQLRELTLACKEWDQLVEQQKEIEGKLQELEASPPSDVYLSSRYCFNYIFIYYLINYQNHIFYIKYILCR